MARYTGPKSKIARKFGEAIFGEDKVLSKKNYTNVDAEMNAMGDEYIKVRKSEYNELKARVAELEDQLKQYKK